MEDREKRRGVNVGEEIEKRESRREAGRKKLRERGRSEIKREKGRWWLRVERSGAHLDPFTNLLN